MEKYYHQPTVRRAIIDFVYSGSPEPRREGAFFNKKIGKIQRHPSIGNEDSVLVIDSEKRLAKALRNGAKAFYSSYWRYSDPSQPSGIRGRDLVWTIKAEEGGLPSAKKATNLFLEALEEEGFVNPLVKYSGELGFDILIPLEDIQTGSPQDIDFLNKVQEDLTNQTSNYIEKNSSFQAHRKNSQITFEDDMGTCLLTELRWRRGLLLAPMSLHPGSGLVSVPLLPSEVSEFSVIEASPEKVHSREWSIAQRIPGGETEAVVRSPAKKVTIPT